MCHQFVRLRLLLIASISLAIVIVVLVTKLDWKNTAGLSGEHHFVGISASVTTKHHGISKATAAKTALLSDDVPMTTAPPAADSASGGIQICLVQYIHMITIMTQYDPNATLHRDPVVQQREKEVLFVLKQNLMHPHVRELHVIAENKTAAENYLESKRDGLTGFEKLAVHDNEGIPTYGDIVSYISDRLQHKLVMFANEDIYLGEGFEKINSTAFQQSQTAYSLTRYDSPAFNNCQRGQSQSSCSAPYVGSHDAFMFYVSQKVSTDALKLLDYTTNQFGAENIFMWVMKFMMKYCVLNPCKAIYIYHIHCSGLHGSQKRIHGKYFTVEPSTTLHC